MSGGGGGGGGGGGHSFLGRRVWRTMFPRNNCPAGQLLGGTRIPITPDTKLRIRRTSIHLGEVLKKKVVEKELPHQITTILNVYSDIHVYMVSIHVL